MSRNTRPMTPAERQAREAELAAELVAAADTGDGGAEVGFDDAPAHAPRRAIRSEHRGQMLDLKELANRISAMPQGVRRGLPLDDEAQAQLDLLAVASGSDRRRVLMRAKLLIGGADLVALEAALDGDTPAAARDRACIQWRSRLVAGDDVVLQAFMERYPAADRQAVRTATRDARGPGPAGERAKTRLLQLVREAAAAPGEED